MRPILRIANAGMLVLFVFWAGFQYNDPDGLLWMAVYGAAAIECVLFLMRRLPRTIAFLYAGLCAAWAAYLAVRVAVAGEFIFDEQGREMMGLLICAGWTFFLIRRQAPAHAPAPAG